MVARHDWITLYANGIRYLEKAPLMYWSMAASFTLFGPQDWAARLPLAIATLALFLVVYNTGRRMFASDIAGFYAALILLTSFGIFIYTRIIIPDVIVCLWLSLAMLLFWISLEQPQPSRWTAWGFAAACALNVLTKGLIGIVFPLAIVVIFLLINRNMGHLRRWHPFSSVLVFLLIALPWHIAAGIANPSQGDPSGTMPAAGNVHGFFWFYFVNEQVLRYLNRRVPRDYDTVPLVLFWGLLAVWLMPWIAFVFKASRARSGADQALEIAWYMGRCCDALLQLLYAAGILCAARAAASRPDDRRLAEPGRGMPCPATHFASLDAGSPLFSSCWERPEAWSPRISLYALSLPPRAWTYPRYSRRTLEITRSPWVIFSI